MTDNTKDNIMQGWTQSCQQAVEGMQKIGEINLAVSRKLWQEQMNLLDAVTQAGREASEKIQQMGSSPNSLNIQAGIAQHLSEKIARCSTACAQIVAEAATSYNQALDKNAAGKNATCSMGKNDAEKFQHTKKKGTS